MAITNLFRGGMPDFKGWFCDGQFAEFTPPFDAPHAKFTPPFDSHADAAHGQGYLNLHFPLVPNLNDTVGHRWMQYALKSVKAVGDVILTNWVPLRSYVDSVYYEANLFDKNLDGVYVKPVAYRVAWDFTNEEWTYTKIDAFTRSAPPAAPTRSTAWPASSAPPAPASSLPAPLPAPSPAPPTPRPAK